MSANAWMHFPVLVVVCSGGVRRLHLLCDPHIICGSQGHKFWLADSRRINSFKIEYWIPARGPRIVFLKYGIVGSAVLCAGYVNPQSSIYLPVIGLAAGCIGNDQPLGLSFWILLFSSSSCLPKSCPWLSWPHTGWFSNMFWKLALLKQMSDMHGHMRSGVPIG